jgi:ketosteroid isomerase-like protein
VVRQRGDGQAAQAVEVGARARLATPVAFTFERFIADGEYVVMQARGQATAVSGLAYDNTYCIVARIVDGQIREMTDYVDTELITRALFA